MPLPHRNRLGPEVRFGPYEIIDLIGVGGMGEVYRARDTRLDRMVAIKVLTASGADRLKARARFEREARAISSLSHAHICAVYDVGHEDDVDYIVMEYLQGESLATRLNRRALRLDHALQYAVQIASALAEAHRAGIVHRDLKPGNVMLTPSGAKLLDFGLAKQQLDESVSLGSTPDTVTVEGQLVGTLPYMAPEQVEGKEADTRSERRRGLSTTGTRATAHFSSSRRSWALCHRSAGSLARQRATRWSSSGGHSACRLDGAGGWNERMAAIKCAWFPSNARCCVIISCSKAPNEKMSLRVSASLPSTCSGAM